jgi:hypothetical protein
MWFLTGFGNEHANLILDEYADELANKGEANSN